MDSTNLVQLKYEPLVWENDSFSSESLEKIKALLTIRKDGNVIYICHPKHLLEVMIENPSTKKIEYVNFKV